MPFPTWLVAPLLVVVLASSACTTRVAGSGSSSESSERTSRTTSSPTPSPSPSPSSSPSAAPSAPLDDVAACADADCRILVAGPTAVPLDPAFGCRSFVVGFIASNRVTFEVDRTELNPLSAYILGTGHLGLANGVKVTIEQVDVSGALLRFTPETMDPANDLTSGSEGVGSYG